jgi:hypothetical protein
MRKLKKKYLPFPGIKTPCSGKNKRTKDENKRKDKENRRKDILINKDGLFRWRMMVVLNVTV